MLLEFTLGLTGALSPQASSLRGLGHLGPFGGSDHVGFEDTKLFSTSSEGRRPTSSDWLVTLDPRLQVAEEYRSTQGSPSTA